jgi:hypothetical protein
VALASTAEVDLVFVDATLTLPLEEVVYHIPLLLVVVIPPDMLEAVYNTLLQLVVVTIPPDMLVISAPDETEVVLTVEGEALNVCTVVMDVGEVERCCKLLEISNRERSRRGYSGS